MSSLHKPSEAPILNSGTRTGGRQGLLEKRSQVGAGSVTLSRRLSPLDFRCLVLFVLHTAPSQVLQRSKSVAA